jgi:hypothetical protein
LLCEPQRQVGFILLQLLGLGSIFLSRLRLQLIGDRRRIVLRDDALLVSL